MDAVEIAMDVVGDCPGYYQMSGFDETADQYRVKTVDQGGAEGDGAEAWWVLEVTDGVETKHVRYVGYYSSWADGEVDRTPVEVKEFTVKEQKWLDKDEVEVFAQYIIND